MRPHRQEVDNDDLKEVLLCMSCHDSNGRIMCFGGGSNTSGGKIDGGVGFWYGAFYLVCRAGDGM